MGVLDPPTGGRRHFRRTCRRGGGSEGPWSGESTFRHVSAPSIDEQARRHRAYP